MSEGDITQIQPEPTPQEGLPSTHNAPSGSTKTPRRDNEKELLEILDGGSFNLTNTVQLAALQRACMAVPNLTPLLTGDRRAKLYTRLLLDDKSEQEVIPDSFASFAADANDDYHAAAITLLTLLAPVSLDETEAVGFLRYLNSRTGFTPDEANTSLMNLLAVVLSDAKPSSGPTALRLLFLLLRELLKDFAIPASSKPYTTTTTLLLRLMLQYHDPALAVHLDQCRISTGELLLHWVRRLFIVNGQYRATLGIIDYLLVLGDPVLIPYVALAYLIANRQNLLSVKTAEVLRCALETLEMELPGVKEAALDPRLVDGRSFAPMPVWSGKTLLQNAELLHRNTPESTKRVLGLCLYPDMGHISKKSEELAAYYGGMPCLPLERADIAGSFPEKTKAADGVVGLEYVIVDCRSRASFDYARLPTAVFVGDVVSFEADGLQAMVERLEAARGAHLAIFGTGRGLAEEANLLALVGLHLAQRGFPYVSLAAGGFKAVVGLMRARRVAVLGAWEQEMEKKEKEEGKGLGAAVSGLVSGAIATPAVQSMLSGLSEIRESLLPRAAAEADEVKGRAAQGLSAATAWGAGLVQRIQASLSLDRGRAEAGASSSPPASASAGAPLQGRVLPRPTHVFTLGGDDDSEDLDLIVSIPVRGKVLAAEKPPTEAPTAPADANESGPLAPVVANIDQEFEQLFGEIETPVHDAPAQSEKKGDEKDLDDDHDIFGDV